MRTGGKTLVTTLLCPKKTSKADLKSLYRQRWHVELDLRALKTTLGMERLSCKTPAMAIKELWVYLLAYNLIRRMMAQAAQSVHVSPRCLSFKHTLQLWIAYRAWHRTGLMSSIQGAGRASGSRSDDRALRADGRVGSRCCAAWHRTARTRHRHHVARVPPIGNRLRARQ